MKVLHRGTLHTALAHQQGGFYERLMSLIKQKIKKKNWSKIDVLMKLLTMITEVEAIINTCPLT